MIFKSRLQNAMNSEIVIGTTFLSLLFQGKTATTSAIVANRIIMVNKVA